MIENTPLNYYRYLRDACDYDHELAVEAVHEVTVNEGGEVSMKTPNQIMDETLVILKNTGMCDAEIRMIMNQAEIMAKEIFDVRQRQGSSDNI